MNINDYRADKYILDLTLDNSKTYSFNSINLNSNYTLYINVGDQDRSIVVNDLNMTNGHIVLNGTGKLTVYVKNQFSMGSSSTINDNGDPNQLNVYYQGPNSLVFSGGQVFLDLYMQNQQILQLQLVLDLQEKLLQGGVTLQLMEVLQTTPSCFTHLMQIL